MPIFVLGRKALCCWQVNLVFIFPTDVEVIVSANDAVVAIDVGHDLNTVFYRFCNGFSILWNWFHWISRFLNIMTIIVLHNSVCYTVFVWRFFTLYCKKFNVCLKKDQKKQKINFEWAIFNKPTYKKTVKYHRANTTIVSWISLRDVKYVSTSAYFIQVNIIVTRIDDNLLNTTYHADCCRQCDQ